MNAVPTGPLRAVCFDLDGVIVDSEPIHFEADRRAMADYGVEFTIDDKKAHFIGNTVRDTMLLLVERHALADGEAVLRARERHFSHLVSTALELREGARGLLERLADRNVPRALVTSGSRAYIDTVFARFDLGALFSGVVTMDDIEAHKPAPDPYLAGARVLDVAPGRCAAVEDSPTGVASAKAAGLYCIAAPSAMTADADLSAADERVDSLVELDDAFLDRLFGRA